MESLSYGYPTKEADGIKYNYSGKRTLVACEPIYDPEVPIGIIGGNNPIIKGIKDHDRRPIRVNNDTAGTAHVLNFPGKSAFICVKGSVDEIIMQNMKRKRTKHDRLHLATVADINNAGWSAWWTPLPEIGQWNHVRLVADVTIKSGIEPLERQLSALCGAFSQTLK